MRQLTVATELKRQVIDITDDVALKIPAGEGVLNVFVLHTTAAITTADLDPGTDLDLLDFFTAVTPRREWHHPHNPLHAPDHLWASTIGPSLTVPFSDGKLLLGTWQRIILIELDGPRQREIIVSV